MNLPKHIEERFDEIVGDVPDNAKFLIDHYGDGKDHVCVMCGHPALHSKAIGNIKSFIAQILEEEKEGLVGEIEKLKIDCEDPTWEMPEDRGLVADQSRNKAIKDVITLIKK